MKETLIQVLKSAKNNLYWNTEMILEIICEQLAEKGIDARWKGRTIYLNDTKIASIESTKEGKNLIGIFKYHIFIND